MSNNASDNIETEYLEVCKKDEWSTLYQQIRSESMNHNFTQLESLKPQNKALNRYRDVSPYDHTRIVLHRGTTDYINANLVKVERANRKYILTQGPLMNTVNHFWLMVWEQNSKAVLMLNKLVEKKREKCFQYWPSKIGSDHIMEMEDVRLKLEYTECQDHSYYLTRTFLLTDVGSGETREIIQFHYTTWPDFGVPSSPTAFLEFLKRVREAGVLEENVGPAVVHCSAGIGRSGTFCLVDSCLVLIEKYGQNSVNIKEILLELRQYRMGLIQAQEQLRFSYQAIIEGAKKLNQNSDDKENCNTEELMIISECLRENDVNSSDDEEPPPLPPPRLESLKNGPSLDRPLPTIPKSTSDNGFNYDSDNEKEQVCPSGPLPIVPAEEDEASEVSEVEDETETEVTSDSICNNRTSSPDAELRHRQRVERKEHLSKQVNDMKRRQEINEQWTQLKRSLYKPFIVTGAFAITGGLLAYIYFKA